PEAVVCGNDSIAKYLTQALRKKGVRVPEDVAVTGFDNDEEDMLSPFFTTVNVDAKWLGKRMVQCFLWRIRHPDAPYEKIAVSGQVVIRKSSCRQKKG
ncbi:MAG: substrate-binding domain-containing protein, partial [Lachnospiraceae bacterium]|nr:substrate-binding domain-containing protein [Lachnospiraceae bacterium]